MEKLRARLRAASSDDRISKAEVEALIRAAMADGSINEMEELFLGAALDAYAKQFDDDALSRLRDFLAEAPKQRR